MSEQTCVAQTYGWQGRDICGAPIRKNEAGAWEHYIDSGPWVGWANGGILGHRATPEEGE